MQLTHFLTVAFATSALAATFKNFKDKACQRSDGTYITVTAAQFQDLAVQEYPTAGLVPQASYFLSSPEDKRNCPANSDDTYAWIHVPQWEPNNQNGGAIAVRYYKETDTYSLCRYLAAAQGGDGYSGSCR